MAKAAKVPMRRDRTLSPQVPFQLLQANAGSADVEHTTIRALNSTISECPLKVGCPENYFSKKRVSNIRSRREVRAPKWGEKKDLGSIQVDYIR